MHACAIIPFVSVRFEHVRPIIALPVTLPTHVHVARVWQWLPSKHCTPTQVPRVCTGTLGQWICSYSYIAIKHLTNVVWAVLVSHWLGLVTRWQAGPLCWLSICSLALFHQLFFYPCNTTEKTDNITPPNEIGTISHSKSYMRNVLTGFQAVQWVTVPFEYLAVCVLRMSGHA